jgi:sugar phosphate isomerase/epimerase
MPSAVTVSLVDRARGGPFVYWESLPQACASAAGLGFDAIEIFAPHPAALERQQLHDLLGAHGLALAAVGTGAGKLLQGLTLTDPEPARRAEAVAFVRGMIERGAEFQAPAIIGSMQGQWGGPLQRAEALALLHEALAELGDYARSHGVTLLYEPLNRYETNLLNTLGEATAFLRPLSAHGVRLLADLFHMNIEEVDLGDALREAAPVLGHVHLVDSNRRAAGLGHLDYAPISAALHDIGYEGYLSAEALPWPDSQQAAAQTMQTYQQWFS